MASRRALSCRIRRGPTCRGAAVILRRKLREPYFVERITAIEEDVLGAYFFRVPEVRLYWMVIGFLSGVLGVSVEAL